MSQSTVTDDAVSCSTAANQDHSIRWHVYERESDDFPGNSGIYLTREINRSVYEPEIQIVSVGSFPKIRFIVNKWILMFKFDGRIVVSEYEENVVPSKITVGVT